MARGRQYLEVDRARIEIIPMIDIMMFLLVFFMIVTLKMIAGSGIRLDLPGSATGQQLSSEPVTIGVQRDGTMYVDGKPTGAPELRAKLAQAKRSKRVEVVIAGDKAISLQTLIGVLDIVRSAGITAVGLATKTDAGR
jgi:biopolymer transport protein ExbD